MNKLPILSLLSILATSCSSDNIVNKRNDALDLENKIASDKGFDLSDDDKGCVLGDYQLEAGPFNDWHWVTITEDGQDLLWTNAAGRSWSLNITDDSTIFEVGDNSPYYDHDRWKIWYPDSWIVHFGYVSAKLE